MAARRPTSRPRFQAGQPTPASSVRAAAEGSAPAPAAASGRRPGGSAASGSAGSKSAGSASASSASASSTSAGSSPAESRSFAELGVPGRLVEALAATGVTEPFPIQAAALPDALAGRDVLGRGRTGSGKTLAFVLPVLARLAASRTAAVAPGRPRALILAPTRELATQIHDTLVPLAAVMGLRSAAVFGGVAANRQITALRRGVDVLVACPGRLSDHLSSGHVTLAAVEITVLDEADHMADLGFLPVVKRLLDQTPERGQRLLFSATLDQGVDKLVRRYLHTPVTHSVDSARSPVSTMTHHVLRIKAEQRLPVLVDLTATVDRSIVFTRTKRGAHRLAGQLSAARVPVVELHGNLTQGARVRNLAAFAGGTASIMVATDIAARGIHVDGVDLVVHADPPAEYKAYLHRSGRTARAGASGTVITLVTSDQHAEVADLTRKAGITATVTEFAPGDALPAGLVAQPRRSREPRVVESEPRPTTPTGRDSVHASVTPAPADRQSGGGRRERARQPASKAARRRRPAASR
jgi:superfamily II DNA/RNA helicase